MPRHTAPTPSEDVRMVEALRAGRPGAGGHVYSVYGPELTEYAEVLLSDHDRAVAAVRSAVLLLRDRPELVPSPDAFQDWLYGLVRRQCREAQWRARRRLMLAGVAAGVALTAGMLLLVEVTSGGGVNAPPMAMNTPAEQPTPATPAPPPPSPAPERREGAPAPAPAKSSPPERHEPADVRGRLIVDDGNCRAFHLIALPSTCHVRLSAKGGPVAWSVSSVRAANGRITTGGRGRLAAGQSVAVPVAVRPTVLCHLGGGVNGTVSFAPGGTATIVYTCLGP